MFSSSKRNKLIIISKRNESVDKLITIFERSELVIIFKRNLLINQLLLRKIYPLMNSLMVPRAMIFIELIIS